MGISNELSSEIAVAILAEKKTPQELRELKEIIIEVHSALQKMSEDARSHRLKTRSLSKPGMGSPSC
jgi:predicted transcriptional regulator